MSKAIKRIVSLITVLMLLVGCGLISLTGNATELKNLVKGLDYTVIFGEPVTYSYGNYETDFYHNDNGQLTDSATALVDPNSNGWFRSFRSGSRIIEFDLGAECAVSSVEAGFLQSSGAAIYAPRYIRVYLSTDGEGYQLVLDYDTDYNISQTGVRRYDAVIDLPCVYAARYVRVEYCCDIFNYCDEIEVYGTEVLDGSEVRPVPDEPVEGGYLTSIDGVNDIIKIYNGYYHSSSSRALNTPEELLPYIAYIDEEGNIKDTMFDAVAFVPCHGDYPSGGRLVKTSGKKGAVMSDWELYYDMTFGDERDLDNLNTVVGTVFDSLGIEGQKYKVFLTIPYPTVLEGAFGDYDGDGTVNGCATLEDRLGIVKWFADKCIAGFEAKEYENLTLAGFYWYREEVNYSDSAHEEELVTGMNSYVQDLGYSTIFDPFYLSIGYDIWQELGFSGCVMQPNVAFRENRPYFSIEMLGEFAQTIYEENIGVEIETDEPSYFTSSEYLEAGYNYESYLYYGAATGYMDAVKTFYQGAGPGSIYDFCYAGTSTVKGQYLRRLYDITYDFLKGTYSNLPPVLEIGDIEAVAGERVMVDISITDEDSYWGDVKVTFPTEPQHGQVGVVAGKTTLIFHADDGYSGSDSFEICVTDGFGTSEVITVNVNISAPDGYESSIEASEHTSDTGSGTGSGNTLTVIILAVSIIVIAAASIVLVKLLKK